LLCNQRSAFFLENVTSICWYIIQHSQGKTMSLFAVPPPTRYDLNFTLLGIPVRVHPLFWLIALLFGATAGNLINLLIWVIAVFVSILIHEMGHSLAMRRYGQDSYIVLHIWGGLAVPGSPRVGGRWNSVLLRPMQHVFISLAGPLAGFLLAALILVSVAASGGVIFMTYLFGVLPFPMAAIPNGDTVVNSAVGAFLWINILWGLINLMPIYPLDGGQVARQLLVQSNPSQGVRQSLWLSVISGALVAVIGATMFGSMYMALMFGMLAFQSYQALQDRGGGVF
jgi:Zn-dependent protease